ncbi:hypothetical protein J437_LFUL001470 [Ladona fulva]|uniref:T-box domain-containing protein n=1 Tax=Ladona fulva TaxID=123851 RepID=A0A8K0JT80_LADFU|nr:hypothetical protein J437_LFUL001470 [Ladona fulva]
MFPPLQVSVTGLNPDSEYYFLLELAPVTSEIPSINGRTRDIGTGDCPSSPRPSLVHRLRFSGREWVVAGRGEAQAPTSSRIYVHPDSPAHGSRWMKGFGRRNDNQEQSEREPEDEGQKEQRKLLKKKHIISFSKVKLTNNSLDGRGHVVLTSMHKYIPRIHIVKASDYVSLSWGPEAVFSFSETEFVAVTAYQNGKITKLKIDHNPFAKGFRENGMSKSKRKLEMMKDSDDGGNSSDEELTKISCLDCNNNGKKVFLNDE